MSRVRTAVVIGGGIAGPVTALALRRAGIDATVYEAHRTGADGRGGWIALAPNGVAALEPIGAVLTAGHPVRRQALEIGGRRMVMPVLEDAGPLHYIRRGDLYGALRDLGAPTAYGKRLVSVRESPGSVSAVFDDGSEASADVLIGADGVHSTVRRLIDPAAPGPRYTGMVAVEGQSPVPVPHEEMTFAFGRQAYYLYSPHPDGGTIWGANLPRRAPLSLVEARRTPMQQWRSQLLAIYGGDVPGGALIRGTPVESMLANGALHIMPPVPHWWRDRMVLVGDAVHAPSNSSGQGAALAIESAIQVARCLRDLPLPEALAAYERLRRARVEGVAARAAKINLTKAPGPIARAVLPVAMRLLMRVAMNPEKTLGPQLRYRIDWDAPVSAAAQPSVR